MAWPQPLNRFFEKQNATLIRKHDGQDKQENVRKGHFSFYLEKEP